MTEIAKSRETSQRHAEELSAEIEERKKAEKMLRSEMDKLQGVLNGIGEGMYIVNRDFVIEYQNDILNDRYGDIVGKKCFVEYVKSTEPCEFCLLTKSIKTNKINESEAVFDAGTCYNLIFSPFSDVDGETKCIILMRDVTEKKRREAETMRAGHLASIGELAAGVAHEINNPINGIISISEIMKDEFRERGEDDEIPNMIIEEGKRIAAIVRNLLSFARSRKEEHSPANILDILTASLGLVERQLEKDGIRLELNVSPNIPKIKARSQEIQQVFLNLLSNARYALNQNLRLTHDGKVLKIDGSEVQIDGRKFVRVSFYDRGVGIPEKMMDKICNPFFSTKPRGEGTGLGLSISHGIVKGHGGKLSFESRHGKYTIVSVDLPVYNGMDNNEEPECG
jgi:signal transduction histidine kinase